MYYGESNTHFISVIILRRVDMYYMRRCFISYGALMSMFCYVSKSKVFPKWKCSLSFIQAMNLPLDYSCLLWFTLYLKGYLFLELNFKFKNVESSYM